MPLSGYSRTDDGKAMRLAMGQNVAGKGHRGMAHFFSGIFWVVLVTCITCIILYLCSVI